jgi:hypothetical protein
VCTRDPRLLGKLLFATLFVLRWRILVLFGCLLLQEKKRMAVLDRIFLDKSQRSGTTSDLLGNVKIPKISEVFAEKTEKRKKNAKDDGSSWKKDRKKKKYDEDSGSQWNNNFDRDLVLSSSSGKNDFGVVKSCKTKDYVYRNAALAWNWRGSLTQYLPLKWESDGLKYEWWTASDSSSEQFNRWLQITNDKYGEVHWWQRESGINWRAQERLQFEMWMDFIKVWIYITWGFWRRLCNID